MTTRRKALKAYHDASGGAVTDEMNARTQLERSWATVTQAKQRLLESVLRYPGMAFVKMDKLHADAESTVDRGMRFIFDGDGQSITLSVLAIQSSGEAGWRYYVYSNWGSVSRNLADTVGFLSLLALVTPIQAALEREAARIGQVGDA